MHLIVKILNGFGWGIFLGFLMILAMPMACSYRKVSLKEPSAMVQNRPPVQWPQKDPSVNLPESQYLDLSLRIMALELTQSSEGKKQFRMEFLPRMGKIEVLCTFKNQNASQVDRSEWQERLTWEIRLVQTGIQDLLEGLEISHGFDSKEHLVLRFQIEDSQPHELAVYRDGKINWLVLPSKTS